MTWARIDDGFPDHPKVIGLSDRAWRLHVTAIVYACRLLTDGYVPALVIRNWGFNKRAIDELLTAGLWAARGTEGYDIHDFLEWNPPRDEVLANQKSTSEQRRAAGLASGRARRERSQQNGNGSFEQTGNTPPNPVQSRPVPSDPIPSHDDEERLSSSSSSAADEGLFPVVRLGRDLAMTAFNALPSKFQRDAGTDYSDFEAFGRDMAEAFIGDAPQALADALVEVRKAGLLPFPGNLRKVLPSMVLEPDVGPALTYDGHDHIPKRTARRTNEPAAYG